MITLDHTCIKKKGKGIYKNSLTSTVATEEKPTDNPTPSISANIKLDDFIRLRSVRDFPKEWKYSKSRNLILVWVEKNTYLLKQTKEGLIFLKELTQPEEIPTTIVYPEIDNPIDNPDFDYPQEIESPDYLEVYPDYMGVDSETDSQESHDHDIKKDFESIVREVRKDIAEDTFLEKCVHYMELLKVSRYEFDSYLDYEFDCEELIGTDDEELLYDMQVKVKESMVFDRLFSLYCPDTGFVIPPKTNHHVREWLDRLEPDGRYFPKKQLSLFGE